VALVLLAFTSCSTHNQIEENPQKIEIEAVKAKELSKKEAPIFRIAMGSCDHEDASQNFWDIIRVKNPAVWVWLGNIIYADTRKSKLMEKKYYSLFNDPYYKIFHSQVRVTGIWGDHDYGEKDVGKNFSIKKKSKELFWNFMQVDRSNSLRYQEGVYRSEEWNIGARKVKLILLDTHYNRDPSADGDLLGEAQWKWLESEFTDSSDYDALLIANARQVLNDKNSNNTWATYPKSREHLLKLIEGSPVKIKILMSGANKQFGEFSHLSFANGTQVTEVLTCGLTPLEASEDVENPYRVDNVSTQNNFAMIDFFNDAKGLAAQLSLNDIETGNEINQVELKGGSSVSATR